MSANAITEGGELYNVDGNGNRVAALIYGLSGSLWWRGSTSWCGTWTRPFPG